jgi:UDP-glucuronate decarboxylase
LFFDYARQHRVKIRVVRIFYTYGPRLNTSDGRVVSNFIVQALCGGDITIYGDGSQTRAFCYVDDLIEGLLAMMAADDDVTGPVNLRNPHEIPVLELAERIIALTGSRSRVVGGPLPVDDPTQRCPGISRARQLLDWEPRVTLEEGLRRTIAYFEGAMMPGSGQALLGTPSAPI